MRYKNSTDFIIFELASKCIHSFFQCCNDRDLAELNVLYRDLKELGMTHSQNIFRKMYDTIWWS